MRCVRPTFIALAILFSALLPSARVAVSHATAGSFVVASALDDGSPGTLRAVLAAAPAGSSITFAQSLVGKTITLSLGPLIPVHNVVISGPGSSSLALSGAYGFCLLQINAGLNVEVDGLAFVDGCASTTPLGASIVNYGTLYMHHDMLMQNTGALAGAIYNTGYLNVFSSTVVDNGAVQSPPYAGVPMLAGGIANLGIAYLDGDSLTDNTAGNEGALYNKGSMVVNNTMFLRNQSYGAAGSIANVGGTLAVASSVFEQNSSVYGQGGIYNMASLSLSSVTMMYNSGKYYTTIVNAVPGTVTVRYSRIDGTCLGVVIPTCPVPSVGP